MVCLTIELKKVMTSVRVISLKGLFCYIGKTCIIVQLCSSIVV